MSRVRREAHAVEHGGVRLHVAERWSGERAGRPVAVLVHGSTTPGEETFDLDVPTRPWASLAQALARAGLDVLVPDVRGFGRSTLPASGVAAAEAATDVAAVVEWACASRQARTVSIVGFSWGAQVAGVVAAAAPGRIARLVLYAPVCAASPGVAARRAGLEALRREAWMPLSAEARADRFRAGVPEDALDPEVAAAWVRAAHAAQPRVPTGPTLDVLEPGRGPRADPRALRAPTLVVHGAHDELADAAEIRALVAALGAEEKGALVVPDAGHFAHLHRGAVGLLEELAQFLLG